jgi:hypothetical protein
MTATTRFHAPELAPSPNLRDARALADVFVAIYRRDFQAFFPQSRFEPLGAPPTPADLAAGPRFRLVEADDEDGDSDEECDGDVLELFGARYRVGPRGGGRHSPHERRLIRAVGAVASLRYHSMFQSAPTPRLDLYRGGSEDHYVAAFLEPSAYAIPGGHPSRIAATIHTLRTAALSTYENRRVSTGALLLGPGAEPARATPWDALPYGVELTALKSVHRLCDGRRTLFLVDRDGDLCDIIDVEHWAADLPAPGDAPSEPEAPCARTYTAHARATRHGGHVCLVLSPNQEIKVFAGGAQAFAFAHGRWRMFEPVTKYAVWRRAVANERVARVLYQTALDLAEERQGGLLVVLANPCEAVGRLIAPHDALAGELTCVAPAELTPGDPLAKRALHYLARGRDVATIDPSVLEALAGLDGALVADRDGRIVAFGAILRHDPTLLHGPIDAEGARTTAALVASRFGPVLKISEDGIISCYLDGSRVWDL